MVVAIGSILGVLGQLGLGAYFYGKLTQKVVDTRDDIAEVKADIKGLSRTSGEHGEAIAGLQARPRYVNGSSH